MVRRIPAGVIGTLLLAATLVPTLAQTPTPEAAADVPTQCMVQPLGVLDILAMLNDVDDAQQVRPLPPIESVSLAEITPGDTVTASDMAAIELTTRNLVGCANTFDVMGVLALLSEDFQMRLVIEAMSQPSMDDLAEQMPMLASDTAETGGIPAITIRSAWYADDSDRKIMAVLEPAAMAQVEQRSFLVTYVFSIDTWLIDDIQLISDQRGS